MFEIILKYFVQWSVYENVEWFSDGLGEDLMKNLLGLVPLETANAVPTPTLTLLLTLTSIAKTLTMTLTQSDSC